ncbi:MoaD/ThiS family protein [Demequina flava]|uniref:MoaD/ThiS family protein n=1 Tax=Demequina flava TaxID=1095025 RepID=UPI0007818F90|nr:MoaD/ThiS family protein [Demequina flava]
MATVRLFAAASEAAGVDQTAVDAGSVGEVRSRLVENHGGDLERVLNQCSFMVDGTRADDDTAITASALVDVLPPFAGG